MQEVKPSRLVTPGVSPPSQDVPQPPERGLSSSSPSPQRAWLEKFLNELMLFAILLSSEPEVIIWAIYERIELYYKQRHINILIILLELFLGAICSSEKHQFDCAKATRLLPAV